MSSNIVNTSNVPAAAESEFATSVAGASEYVLWASPHSLYSGKLRAYLLKKGLPFRELCPSHPRFAAVVQPAIEHFVVPVLETPAGEILQDTDEIIDHLESTHPEPALRPVTPLQQAVSMLLSAYASEALLPHAMHYRWTYRSDQEDFLRAEFGRVLRRRSDRGEQRAAAAELMAYFNAFLPVLGVTPATIPLIEATYLDLLEALDAHFQCHPYLLGGRPCDADFGFTAPFFAHLARDPVPSQIMKTRAPNVYRWTERMQTAGVRDGEFWDQPEDYLPDDAIPGTLEPVLRLLFETWGPELRATAQSYAHWIAAQPERPAGTLVSHDGQRKVHPTLGPIEYCVRDVTVHRAGSLHTLWLFDRGAAYARRLQGDAAVRFKALVARCGGSETMNLSLARPMRREHHVLVLA